MVWSGGRVFELDLTDPANISMRSDPLGQVAERAVTVAKDGQIFMAWFDTLGTLRAGPFLGPKLEILERAAGDERVEIVPVGEEIVVIYSQTRRRVDGTRSATISAVRWIADGRAAPILLQTISRGDALALVGLGGPSALDLLYPDTEVGRYQRVTRRPLLPIDVSHRRIDRSPRLGVPGDADEDGITDGADNCPLIWNPLQGVVGAAGCCRPDRTGPRCATCIDPRLTGDGCDECAPGYTGPACTACVADRYAGEDCLWCSDRFTGTTCDVCRTRFTGPGCESCADGYRGPDCEACTDPHRAGALCQTCADGFAGEDCSGCAPGFAPPDCQSCVPGVTGASCDQCIDPRFTGPGCEACARGYVEPDCEIGSCSGICEVIADCVTGEDSCPGIDPAEREPFVAFCQPECVRLVPSGIRPQDVTCDLGVGLLQGQSEEFRQWCIGD